MLLVPEKIEEYRESFEDALLAEDMVTAATASKRISSTRAAELLSDQPDERIVSFLLGLEPSRAGVILAAFSPELAAAILRLLPREKQRELLSNMPVDCIADILGELPSKLSKKIRSLFDADLQASLEKVRRYPPGSAGGAMSPEFQSVESGNTIREVLSAVTSAPRRTRGASYLFIVDLTGRLKGSIPTRELLRHSPDQTIDSVMNVDPVAIKVGDSAVEAAELIRNRVISLLPVVDDNQLLVGVIAFDDAIDILTEHVADQVSALGASSADESFFTPPLGSVQKRLPWMAANVFLNLGAVAVITGFEETIAQVAILAAFIPMITDMGGNVGIQSLSVAIRSIALKEVQLGEFWRAVRKEVIIGLVNGLALGILFAILAYVIQGNYVVGLLAGVALGINVFVAGIVGGGLPFLIKRLGKDPAMMTGPILTTITDITGVSIYLGLSTIFLVYI